MADVDSEAYKRSAVSRAYYAAYCTARSRLKRDGVVIPEYSSDHSLVWEAFKNKKKTITVRIWTIGMRLRNLRNDADYKDQIVNIDGNAQLAIRESEEIFKLLDKCGPLK